ncbi:uncharacterized protein LOC114881752 [Osmia bicornis bicornis]|uniref:uncharacterized protein LOC114881752 n=1 Tax=Osmia bicornis bicornis TaxID=1437191 RepID=UPI001EAF79CF|nr:uncharacterized protein LOC114881752 [Osmia bicornis bicornis]
MDYNNQILHRHFTDTSQILHRHFLATRKTVCTFVISIQNAIRIVYWESEHKLTVRQCYLFDGICDTYGGATAVQRPRHFLATAALGVVVVAAAVAVAAAAVAVIAAVVGVVAATAFVVAAPAVATYVPPGASAPVGAATEETNLKTKLKKLRYKFWGRWQLAKRRNDLFLNQNQNWLLGTADLPRAKNKDGRPKKSFTDLSERGKRKRTEQMRRTVDTEELRFAMGSKLRESGQLEASKLVHEIAASPTRANKFRRAYMDNLLNQRKETLSLFKALAIYVDTNLSRTQYEVIRTSDTNLFPCYSKLQAAKKDCYPVKEAIKVSATCAEVNLQDLLNHTALRLLTYLGEIIEQLHQSDGASFELILKWGCDGSQQKEYKQKFENDTDSDAQIFQSSMVPLRLTSGKNVVWQNPTPSSPRYCRPIRLQFVKETSKIIQEEVNYVQDQINNLQIINIGEHEVKFTMKMTMGDAKGCNAITSTLSTMRCYICGATSSTFNNLSVTKEIDPDAIKFGLSILHARIRLFETLLHLAHKLPIKKWQIRTETDKNLVN